MMIDEIYNYRIGAIKTDSSSNKWEKLVVQFEKSLTEEQTVVLHNLCDLLCESCADEMRAAYKAGFKDGMALILEIQKWE